MEQYIKAATSTTQRTVVFAGVLIVIGLLVFWGLFSFLSGKQKPSSTTNVATALPAEVAVEVKENGFVPKEVTIDVGSAVRWVNKTNGKVTVNSDDHPTHRKYKELNLGEFAKDSTVVLIFTKAGTYTYHDHLHPNRKGSVTVK